MILKLKHIAPGLYRTRDGRYDVRKIDGGPGLPKIWVWHAEGERAEDSYRTKKAAVEALNAWLKGNGYDEECVCETGFEACCHTQLATEARRFFGYTDTLEEAGYVLPDGRALDFSGRHQHPDYEWNESRSRFVTKPGKRDEQVGQRTSDHREVSLLASFPKGRKDTRGDDMDKVYIFLMETGSARVNAWAGVELASVPTEAMAKSIARSWYRDFPQQNYIEVEMWLSPREIKATSVQKPISASRIIEAAKELWAKCQCVSGLEPCCHGKKRKKAA